MRTAKLTTQIVGRVRTKGLKSAKLVRVTLKTSITKESKNSVIRSEEWIFAWPQLLGNLMLQFLISLNRLIVDDKNLLFRAFGIWTDCNSTLSIDGSKLRSDP